MGGAVVVNTNGTAGMVGVSVVAVEGPPEGPPADGGIFICVQKPDAKHKLHA
jgi:hypothetical protein